MAEKSIDIVGEKIERLDVRRNTSNQIISYTLPDDSEKLYGIHRISGQKTAFPLDDFDRVIYSKPSELVNPIPQFEINIVKKGVVNTGLFVKQIQFKQIPTAPIMLDVTSDISTDLPTSPVVAPTPTSFGVTTLPTSPVVAATPSIIPKMNPITIELPNYLGVNSVNGGKG